jgi:hypothetical protein
MSREDRDRRVAPGAPWVLRGESVEDLLDILERIAVALEKLADIQSNTEQR